MAKKQKGTYLSNLNLTIPDYGNWERNQPKIDYERLRGLIKPQSESFQEAVKPLQEELILLRQQAELANQRAEEAEQKAKKQTNITYWATIIGTVIAILSFMLAGWQTIEARTAESALTKSKSQFDSLARQQALRKNLPQSSDKVHSSKGLPTKKPSKGQ